jgi:hypothetical protein
MGKGMKSFARKQRREQRRRNHIAKDLHSNKYRQRVQHKKPKNEPTVEEWDEEPDRQ